MPNTPLDSRRSFLPSFLQAIEQLGQLLHLAYAGMGAAFVLGGVVNRPQPGKEPDPRTVELEKWGKEQTKAGFPLLWELATVRLDGILNAMVDRFVTPRGRRLRSPAPRPVRSRKQRRVYGFNKLERRLEEIGYCSSVPAEVRDAITELIETRDAIVHRLGIVDDRLLKTCPWLSLKIGEPVRIGERKFNSYKHACTWYLLELSLRAQEAGEVEIDEPRDKLIEVQASVLKALRS